MSRPLTLVYAGASGLVGGLGLRRLLARVDKVEIHVPTRRSFGVADARVHEVMAGAGDASALTSLTQAWSKAPGHFDVYACALGTTLRTAGSRQAFIAVDHDLVLGLAGIARGLGARQAIVVSSVGADPRSSNFYLRVKGETESAIAALGFERVDFLQPGLLLGTRSGAPRPGERLAQVLAPIYNPLLRGPLRRYAAIGADRVAAAMVALVGEAGAGVRRWENPAIEALART